MQNVEDLIDFFELTPPNCIKNVQLKNKLNLKTLSYIKKILSKYIKSESLYISAIIYLFCKVDFSKSIFPENLRCKIQEIDRFFAMASFYSMPQSAKKINNLRKMFLTIIKDIRYLVVLLCHKIYLLNSIDLGKDLIISVENMYIPLANRLGLSDIKWLLEDLIFKFNDYDSYKLIASRLNTTLEKRKLYLKNITSKISKLLEGKISFSINYRAKNIKGIFNKMQEKSLAFSDIHDKYAIRLILNSIDDCYVALDILRNNFNSIDKDFVDYIASPKANGYRSIHMVILDPSTDELIEIQIRTILQHRFSESGVGAHWAYKEKLSNHSSIGAEIQIIREKVLDCLLMSNENNQDSIAQLSTSLFDDRVFVFTPKHEVYELPKGATALDFAYYIHTQVGHRCRGALVNGKITTLCTPLLNGDKVEILLTSKLQPSRDWLDIRAGFLKTSQARKKLFSWFRKIDDNDLIAKGKHIVLKELRKQKKTKKYLEAKLFTLKSYNSLDSIYRAVAKNDISLQDLLQDDNCTQETKKTLNNKIIEGNKHKKNSQHQVSSVIIIGVGAKVVFTTANCCKPCKGNKVNGFLSNVKGLVIHKTICSTFNTLKIKSPEKCICIDWK